MPLSEFQSIRKEYEEYWEVQARTTRKVWVLFELHVLLIPPRHQFQCLYTCESQNQGQITEISLITKRNPKTQGFEKRTYLKSKRISLSIEKLNMNKKSVVESSSKIYYLYST